VNFIIWLKYVDRACSNENLQVLPHCISEEDNETESENYILCTPQMKATEEK
jgi:hypothetical protein